MINELFSRKLRYIRETLKGSITVSSDCLHGPVNSHLAIQQVGLSCNASMNDAGFVLIYIILGPMFSESACGAEADFQRFLFHTSAQFPSSTLKHFYLIILYPRLDFFFSTSQIVFVTFSLPTDWALFIRVLYWAYYPSCYHQSFLDMRVIPVELPISAPSC